MYKDICELERSQQSKNPENKGVYKEVTTKISDGLARFNNELSTVKIHFVKKSAAKSWAKKAPLKRSEDSEWICLGVEAFDPL